ncbi:MAG: HD domain-containing protein [Bulleidia sp.]
MMNVNQAIEKMIVYYEGNRHDIAHFIKVHAYARMIGEMEQLDEDTQYRLELAAVVHDIACPLCRRKYGNTNGKYQEAESDVLIREFFDGMDISTETVDRISWIVSHHHTYHLCMDPDYQILLEADYLVNADESSYTQEAIAQAYDKLFETESGKRLLKLIYLV